MTPAGSQRHQQPASDTSGERHGDGVVSGFIDARDYVLSDGVNQLQATLGELQSAYQKYLDENVEDLDYIIINIHVDNGSFT